ncbi:MAG: ATP-dependent helicase RecG, partial [Frankiaceae bacterium]|nr:ATP-dependent helicase RecG [Frankiaceae bacterium]
MADLSTPLLAIVGDKTAKLIFAELDAATVGEFIRHYPRRYAERTELSDVSDVPDGEHVTVVGKVVGTQTKPMRQRKGTLFEVELAVGNGRVYATFFGRGTYGPSGKLVKGAVGLFAGQLSTFASKRQLTHPDYALLDDDAHSDIDERFAAGIIPIYPATAKLASWTIAKAMRVVLDMLDAPADALPKEMRRRLDLAPLSEALEGVHRPRTWAHLTAAKDRLRWDEAYFLQVSLAKRRLDAGRSPATPRIPLPGGLLDAFDARLPFTLTDGQKAVAAELAADIARDFPMHRLLQGEVGSGKTVVAVRAMLAVADTGGQSALLAPTEVLAAQHFRAISALLGPLAERGQLGGADTSTRVVLLTGSQTTAQRRAALLAAASGEAGIVVGTHALIQDVVQFAELGLVVVDEQHRFGVHQRDALRAKGRDAAPHLLVMTATPIPRTVAM